MESSGLFCDRAAASDAATDRYPAGITDSVLARYDTAAPRYTSYPPVTAWTTAINADSYAAALASTGADPVALYIHLPFCGQRCLYCGCNATITRNPLRVDRYLDALEAEFALVARALGRRATVTQVHLGGGTPNHLTEKQLWRLGHMIDVHMTVRKGAERSVEADPRLITAVQLATLRAMGFDRISFGVQDLDEDVQEAIGRKQPIWVVAAAVAEARAAGFGNVNLDLIYGLPRQTPVTWRRTIEQVLELRPDRVACFGYAHVPWMAKHQRAIDETTLPDQHDRFAFFADAVRRFRSGGYEWIGLDHFALPDDTLTVAQRDGSLRRTFMGYTTVPAPHLIGVGVSAISDVGGVYVQNDADLHGWASAVEGERFATLRGHERTADDHVRGAIIHDLFCTLRAPADDPALRQRAAALVDDGLLFATDDGFSVTERGRYFLRNVATVFDGYITERAAGSTPQHSRSI
jgi:oxygen-independent coproporphyrinogen-3 oxidase